jgi:hypothetical protein
MILIATPENGAFSEDSGLFEKRRLLNGTDMSLLGLLRPRGHLGRKVPLGPLGHEDLGSVGQQSLLL